MPTKNLVFIALNGAPDYFNIISARDATSVTKITNARTNAPANVLNYDEAITKTGTLTLGSNVITALADVVGLAAGQLVYSSSLKARRSLRIASVGTTSVTLEGPNPTDTGAYTSAAAPSYVTATANARSTVTETITFSKATAGKQELIKLSEATPGTRNPALHSGLKFFADAFNTVDNAGNLLKTKATVIANIAPLRKQLIKNTTTGAVTVRLANGTILTNPLVDGLDVPSSLTAHDKQQAGSSLTVEGAGSEGWGAGIMDYIFPSVIGAKNSPLIAVATAGSPVFTVGTFVRTFDININGLISRLPNFVGKFSNGTAKELVNQTDAAARDKLLADIFLAASTTVTANDDFGLSTRRPMDLAKDYQNVLVDVMNITDVPTVGMAYNFTSPNANQVDATQLAGNLKQAARMMHALAPNRGAECTRVGTTVTVVTEQSFGTITRVLNSTTATCTVANHGLFTSSKNTLDLTDSVIILSDSATVIDTNIPADGYKITLDPDDPDNKFTITTTDVGALSAATIRIRLKHNVKAANVGSPAQKVYFETTGFDSASPAEGYDVTAVTNNFTFTVTTTATGAFTPASKFALVKLLNLPNQVFYVDANYMGWDSHEYANHNQLSALDAACDYFDSLISRMKNTDTLTFAMGEFGRTIGTNGRGTDHGHGGGVLVFGKSVRSRKVVGTIPDYETGTAGASINSGGYLIPSTSVYQMVATYFKWLVPGTTDTQVLDLLPDLGNWNLAERNLGFLDALV